MRLPLPRLLHSRPHLVLAIALGMAAGPFLPASWALLTRVMTAWNVAVWVYLLTMGTMMMRADRAKVKRIAAQQDENSAVILSALCVAAFMSLSAIVFELSKLHDLHSDERAFQYGFVVVTLLGSWFLVGTLFCFHYAHLYYKAGATARPLAFPDQHGKPYDEPDYWDFLYFSFTIAVAAQTSDVVVRDYAMRKLVLGQSVLSFFFNLFILGLSINIAASVINN